MNSPNELPTPYRRKSLRRPGYDYALPGGYFITICTENRVCSLGTPKKGQIGLSEAGHIVQRVWRSLPERYAAIEVDAFVVMPNHIHGIVLLNDDATSVTLGDIVRTFKAASARLIHKAGWADFAWQANYYDHVIRNERDFQRVREYIEANPARWGEDPENPASQA